jgi:inhibitor of KinA
MTLEPLGDSAVVVTLGSMADEETFQKVRRLTRALEQLRSPLITDVVPVYATVAIHYDLTAWSGPIEAAYQQVCRIVRDCFAGMNHGKFEGAECSPSVSGDQKERQVEIPVSYGGACGPDLEEVANHCGLSCDDVVALHLQTTYTVQAVGFTPGFPYLGGLSPRLHTPRKRTPRVSVPAGSVGIGGGQTGIYPLTSPGGWQLIGRTPRKLFDHGKPWPALLRVGDRVRFIQTTENDVVWS